LSLDEEQFIRDNITSLSLEEIADAINRNIAPVKRYIEENSLLLSNSSDDTQLRQKLHIKTFWREIKRQFDDL
jgi:hypothetical protein